jgi:hypothetical protein
MATYRTRKAARTTVLITIGLVLGVVISQAIDFVRGWL